MRIIQITSAILLITPASAFAHGGSHPPDPKLHVDPTVSDCEVHFAPELSQSAFRRFTREFGSVSAFKQVQSSNTLGQWRVSVGIEYMSFSVDEKSDAWNDTFSHPEDTHELGSNHQFPKLKLRVGVAERTDLGLFYTMNPQSNYGWIGLDVKHAIWRQNAKTPVALSIRGAYTKTLFVSDMDMHALSAGVSIARTIWNTLTPYLGFGSDVVLARETASTVELDTEVVLAPHAFAGVEVAFWHLALGAEAQLAAIPSVHVQVSAVF